MRDYPFIYSQRDPAWASQRLGTVDGATIGGYGCLLTCQAMKAGYYGHEIKPNALDDIFTNRSIYVQGDLLPDVGIHQVFDDVKLLETKVYSGPADMAYIKVQADDPTKTVTIEVDFDHNPNDGIQTHFVELHSFDGVNLRIYDPWYGQEDDFATHYGTNPQLTIQKVSVYQGTPAQPGTFVDAKTFTQLVAKSSANDAVCDELGLSHDAGKDAEVAAIAKTKADSASKDTTINNLNKQIPELEGEVKTLNNELTDVTTKAGLLQETVDKYNEMKPLYDQLQSDYDSLRKSSADYQERTNRQIAQFQNTSYLSAPTGVLVKEVMKRLFKLK